MEGDRQAIGVFSFFQIHPSHPSFTVSCPKICGSYLNDVSLCQKKKQHMQKQ